jgi:hypothetical protein
VRNRLRTAAPALLVCTLVACDDQASHLGNLLIASVAGYSVSSPDSGALDREAAAQSLPTSADVTGRALDAAGFSAGYSRVFLGGSTSGDYVLASVYAVSSPATAARFVDAEKQALAATGSVAPFADARIPGAAGFILSGPTKRGNRDVFCEGVLFPKGAQVYAITTCSPLPGDTVLATQIAETQVRAG